KDTNFGFVVQSRDGLTIEGQLEYHDRAGGINLPSSSFSALNIQTDARRGTFTGKASINGKAGYTFTVEVVDNGETGSNDKLTITIPELGYVKSGTLVKGNIQIHSIQSGSSITGQHRSTHQEIVPVDSTLR